MSSSSSCCDLMQARIWTPIRAKLSLVVVFILMSNNARKRITPSKGNCCLHTPASQATCWSYPAPPHLVPRRIFPLIPARNRNVRCLHMMIQASRSLNRRVYSPIGQGQTIPRQKRPSRHTLAKPSLMTRNWSRWHVNKGKPPAYTLYHLSRATSSVNTQSTSYQCCKRILLVNTTKTEEKKKMIILVPKSIYTATNSSSPTPKPKGTIEKSTSSSIMTLPPSPTTRQPPPSPSRPPSPPWQHPQWV